MSETSLVGSDLNMNVPIQVIVSTFAFHYCVDAHLEVPTLLLFTFRASILFNSLNQSSRPARLSRSKG